MEKILNFLKALFNKKYIYFPRINISKKWIGNDYGGFYIYPNSLHSNSIVFSFGIGEDISFDKGLINEYNLNVIGFDPTPKSINFINNETSLTNFTFYPYGISSKTESKKFFTPKNKDHVSGSLYLTDHLIDDNTFLNFKSFNDILKETQVDSIDLIKMDIEGSEYNVLNSILKMDIPIKQILVEFHPQMFKNGLSLTRKTFKKLNKNGFKCFAVSNTFSEFSFINTNFISL